MTVHLIAGPPGAGKTRYALEAAGPKGLVVDYELVEAKVGPERAQAVRLAAEAAAADQDRDVYVVRSLANAHDREGVAARIRAATTTVLTTPAEVAAARLRARDGAGADTAGPATWWAAYVPRDGDRIITPTHQDNLVGRATVPRTAPAESEQAMSGNIPTPGDVANGFQQGVQQGGQQGGQGGQGGQQGGQDGQDGTRLPTTQEELDRLIGRRVAQAERQVERRLAEAAQVDLQARLDQARQEATQATERKYTERLARTTIEAAATRVGFHDPADAVAYVPTADVVADGEVDAKAIEAKLAELAQSKPYLVGRPQSRGNYRMRQAPPEQNTAPKPKGSASLLSQWSRG